jgi:hypothetical protein
MRERQGVAEFVDSFLEKALSQQLLVGRKP